jgi:hypothetical protein
MRGSSGRRNCGDGPAIQGLRRVGWGQHSGRPRVACHITLDDFGALRPLAAIAYGMPAASPLADVLGGQLRGLIAATHLVIFSHSAAGLGLHR